MPAALFSKRVHDAVGISPTDRELLKALRVAERTLDDREALCREGDTATQCAIDQVLEKKIQAEETNWGGRQSGRRPCGAREKFSAGMR